MSYLLDTNIVIWLFEGNPRLSAKAQDTLLAGTELNYISVVSGWEYELKRKMRPNDYELPFAEIISRIPHETLNLKFEIHAFAESLPLIHCDPFDRMLIAQAIHHDLEFIASDKAIHQYPVRIFW